MNEHMQVECSKSTLKKYKFEYKRNKTEETKNSLLKFGKEYEELKERKTKIKNWKN